MSVQYYSISLLFWPFQYSAKILSSTGGWGDVGGRKQLFFLFMCKFSPNLYLISYELWVVLTLCQVLGFVLSWLFLLWPRAKSHCGQESPNGWENTVAGYHCISLFLGISEPFHTIYSSWIKDCITHFLNVIHNTDISFRKTLTILHFTIWHKNILF